jgi:hypothetical protein
MDKNKELIKEFNKTRIIQLFYISIFQIFFITSVGFYSITLITDDNIVFQNSYLLSAGISTIIFNIIIFYSINLTSIKLQLINNEIEFKSIYIYFIGFNNIKFKLIDYIFILSTIIIYIQILIGINFDITQLKILTSFNILLICNVLWIILRYLFINLKMEN